MIDNMLVREGRGKTLLVLPASLHKEVLNLLHGNVAGEQMGVDKTMDRVRERYYWPGYAKDVQEYVPSCTVCQGRTAAAPSAQSTLKPIASD